MEIGSVTRGTPLPTTAPQRVDPQVPAGSVKTELNPDASVQPLREIGAVRFDQTGSLQSRAALDKALREVIERNTVIDPKTREVVYQTLDRDTGEVVRQVPDETLLRLRAFAREMREKEGSAERANTVSKLA